MIEGKPVVVLLVEDNPDHAELVVRSLKAHRLLNEIVHLSDGEAAMDYLRQRGAYADPQKNPRPDVVLLDLRLPRMDGLEVLEEIKTDPALRSIPVVILTTSESGVDIGKAYERYVNSYLVKPVDYAKFVQMMNDLGFYWMGWNRQPGQDPCAS